MTQSINTSILFAIPMGYATLPREVCDIFKPLKGQIQSKSTADPKHYDVLVNHQQVKNDITDIFSLWVNNTYNYPNQKWKMLTNWITDNTDGSAMVRHRHYNCMFSAVLYFDGAKNGQGNLVLESPMTHSDFFPDDGKNEPTIFSSKSFTCALNEGLLIFFPSNLYHSYPKYKPTKNVIRRSFACNFAPIGKLGFVDSSLDTNLLQHDG
tara:strand:+ start:44 stop:670 length:627 start_codon:yes stop_codon:yes gene_type:complete